MDSAEIKFESFEYIELPAARFIGIDALRTGEGFCDLWRRRGEWIPALGQSGGDACAFPYDCALKHHDFKDVANPMHYIAGRFMKAGTPAPEGYDFLDFPPMRAAYAVIAGEFKDLGAVIRAVYDATRDRILREGVSIPYPEAYWTAEVYLKHPDVGGGCHLGYLFSVGK